MESSQISDGQRRLNPEAPSTVGNGVGGAREVVVVPGAEHRGRVGTRTLILQIMMISEVY